MKVKHFNDIVLRLLNNTDNMNTNARTGRVLDKTVNKSRDYQNALKQQDIALNKIDKAGLNQKQKLIVDRAISAANNCGAVYGAAAYRLGLHNGIKVMSEILRSQILWRKSLKMNCSYEQIKRDVLLSNF